MATITKKRKPVKPCNCLALTQAALAEKCPNYRLETRLCFNFTTGKARMAGPLLAVEKIDPKKRGRAPAIFPTYCPFCGKKCQND